MQSALLTGGLKIQPMDRSGVEGAAYEITKAQRVAFERDGYLVLRAFLTREQCRAMAEEAWSLLPERFDRRDPASWRGRIQDCCSNVPLYQRKGLLRMKSADGFQSLPATNQAVYQNPALNDVFGQLTGKKLARLWVRGINPNFPFPRTVSINELFGNRLDPEVRGKFWDRLRIKTPPQAPIPGHLETHALDLGAFIYLTDVARNGGAVGVWPGSHRLFRLAFSSPLDFAPNRLYKRLALVLLGYRPTMVDGKAGDMILFHNRLFHGNSYNRSDVPRQMLVIDGLARGWVGRAAQSPGRGAERKRLYGAESLKDDPLVREVTGPLRPDRLGSLLVSMPRLNKWLLGISRDADSDARSHLSRKVRQRRAGDLWVVISQGSEYFDSYKLDAYGVARNGRFRMQLDGGNWIKSVGGIIVEQVPAEGGARHLRLSGRFDKDHYLRVIQTTTPFASSPTLFRDIIPAGTTVYQAEFSMPDAPQRGPSAPCPGADATKVA